MSSFFINGAKYAVSSSLAAAVAISALSNASPAVASTTTPAAIGDICLLTSGWEELNEAPIRVSAVAAGVSMTLEGVDTTNTVRFPAGEGVGTFEKVTGWTGMTQITEVNQTGGEQQFEVYQYVGDAGRRQRKKPTYKNAMDVEFVMDYDPDLAWYAKLVELDFLAEPVIIRETLTNGDVLYYAGTIAFNKVPTKQMNKNMQVRASLSMSTDPIRFAS